MFNKDYVYSKCDVCGHTFYSQPHKMENIDKVISIILIVLTGGLFLIPLLILLPFFKKRVKCPCCGKVIFKQMRL